MNLSRNGLTIIGAISGLIIGVVVSVLGGAPILFFLTFATVGAGEEPSREFSLFFLGIGMVLLIATTLGGFIGHVLGGRQQQQPPQAKTGFLTKAAILIAIPLIVILLAIMAVSSLF